MESLFLGDQTSVTLQSLSFHKQTLHFNNLSSQRSILYLEVEPKRFYPVGNAVTTKENRKPLGCL